MPAFVVGAEKKIAERVEAELERLKAARPHLAPRIACAEDIVFARAQADSVIARLEREVAEAEAEEAAAG